MSKGARPDIFTYAMLGEYDVIKGMIDATPGVQTIAGPHGIGLLTHCEIGLRSKDITAADKAKNEKLIAYLKELGNADGPQYDKLDEAVLENYTGDYMYGEGPNDGFSIKINMRKMIALGRLGKFGGGLYPLGNNRFVYNGTPSVEISFEMVEGKAISLTVHEPDLTLKATKI